MIDFKSLLSNEYIRLIGVLLIGITIGVVFYPTKRIEEKVSQKYEQEIAVLKEQHKKESLDEYFKYTASLKEELKRSEESERKVSKLTDEVKSLKTKSKTATYKLVKPDGTIEERTFSESEVDENSHVVTQIQEEFKTKIEQIETKYATIHSERVLAIKKEFDSKEQEYKQTISVLEKSRTISVNEKKFGLEAGIMNNKNYYGHATMDVWGPTFVGIQGELGPNDAGNKLGIGLGLRF